MYGQNTQSSSSDHCLEYSCASEPSHLKLIIYLKKQVFSFEYPAEACSIVFALMALTSVNIWPEIYIKIQ